MIEAIGLTKRYGPTTALDHASFTVAPGKVTGFLGPNGAGKSTTMRMVVGLDRPTAGTVTVNGKRYADHAAPLHEVGVLLDAKAVHRGRSARNHLLALAATHGIGKARVEEVIELDLSVEDAAKLIMTAGMIQPGNGNGQKKLAALAEAARFARNARSATPAAE